MGGMFWTGIWYMIVTVVLALLATYVPPAGPWLVDLVYAQ
jgi:hypothetical protein